MLISLPMRAPGLAASETTCDRQERGEAFSMIVLKTNQASDWLHVGTITIALRLPACYGEKSDPHINSSYGARGFGESAGTMRGSHTTAQRGVRILEIGNEGAAIRALRGAVSGLLGCGGDPQLCEQQSQIMSDF
jgi:hypothetical protein